MIDRASIVVSTVDLRRCTVDQRLALLRALHAADRDPKCVSSWWHNPIRRTITLTVVGPAGHIEAVKRACDEIATGIPASSPQRI